jgi:hypothetical protein
MSMRSLCFVAAAVGSLLISGLAPTSAHAELPKEYRECVAKGLEYLANKQDRDGHWEGAGAQYPVTLTALSGLALLMEGSTLHEGKYQKNLRRAVDWLCKVSQRDGMLNNPTYSGEHGHSMFGHGYALLFLSSVFGEEEDIVRRRQLEGLLTQAASFSREAQSKRGGWGYVPARECDDFDEGSVTVIQVQALCAARDAGIGVPAAAIKDAMAHLVKASDNSSGGVVYSLACGGGGEGRPPLTAAAIVCGFGAGDYKSPLIKKWLKFSVTHFPTHGDGRMGLDEYTHYYFAQVVYMLGDDGWGKLFPDEPAGERVTWTKYRKANFDNIKQAQKADGSWPCSYPDPIYATAVFCTIMQLDNGSLPIHQRKGMFAP